jgi:hypothetical protein
VNKRIGLVTVTYKQDFEIITGLLETINQYVGDEFDHTIILNDSVEHMSELLMICSRYPRQNRTIIHCDDVGEFKNHKQRFSDETDARYGYHRSVEQMSGWMTQQILSFCFSQICTTEFFIIVHSRRRILVRWDLNWIIRNNKSPVELHTDDILAQMIPGGPAELFLEFFKTAYSKFGLDHTKETELITCASPMIWRTRYVLDLLAYIDKQGCTIFNYINPYLILPTCNEAYLYGAWLRFKNLTDTTYVTNFNNIMYEVR